MGEGDTRMRRWGPSLSRKWAAVLHRELRLLVTEANKCFMGSHIVSGAK
jgi:hypothetical protein